MLFGLFVDRGRGPLAQRGRLEVTFSSLTPQVCCENTDKRVATDSMCSNIIYGAYFAQKHALLVVETFFAFPETNDTRVYFLLRGCK